MPFPTSHGGEPPGSGHLGVVQATIQLLHTVNQKAEQEEREDSRAGERLVLPAHFDLWVTTTLVYEQA